MVNKHFNYKYKTTLTSVRPSIDVPFFMPSAKHYALFNEKYIKTGKALPRQRLISNDGLTLTVITWFESKSAWMEYRKEVVPVGGRGSYDSDNGIVVSFVEQQI
jgi:hypothetical protein